MDEYKALVEVTLHKDELRDALYDVEDGIIEGFDHNSSVETAIVSIQRNE